MPRTLKNILVAVALIASSSIATVLNAATVQREIAVEGVTIRFFLEQDATGIAVARECDKCDPIRLKVAPTMKIYIDGNPNRPMQWDANLSLGNQKADIIYRPGGKQLVKIFLH